MDWNSQIHATRRYCSEPTGKEVIAYVLRKLEQELKNFPRNFLFEITIRAYCGWHKGYTPTELRKRLSSVSIEDLHEMGNYPNMPIRTLEFGDLSAGALPERLVKSTGSHFPATCRERGHKNHEEKMVDTALVSDLIYLSATDDASWLVVIGEDIDLMPGVYVAEALMENSNRKLAYLWSQREKYLNCAGLDSLAPYNGAS